MRPEKTGHKKAWVGLSRKAQAVVEYSLLIGAITLAFLTMQKFITSGLESNVAVLEDQVESKPWQPGLPSLPAPTPITPPPPLPPVNPPPLPCSSDPCSVDEVPCANAGYCCDVNSIKCDTASGHCPGVTCCNKTNACAGNACRGLDALGVYCCQASSRRCDTNPEHCLGVTCCDPNDPCAANVCSGVTGYCCDSSSMKCGCNASGGSCLASHCPGVTCCDKNNPCSPNACPGLTTPCCNRNSVACKQGACRELYGSAFTCCPKNDHCGNVATGTKCADDVFPCCEADSMNCETAACRVLLLNPTFTCCDKVDPCAANACPGLGSCCTDMNSPNCCQLPNGNACNPALVPVCDPASAGGIQCCDPSQNNVCADNACNDLTGCCCDPNYLHLSRNCHRVDRTTTCVCAVQCCNWILTNACNPNACDDTAGCCCDPALVHQSKCGTTPSGAECGCAGAGIPSPVTCCDDTLTDACNPSACDDTAGCCCNTASRRCGLRPSGADCEATCAVSCPVIPPPPPPPPPPPEEDQTKPY